MIDFFTILFIPSVAFAQAMCYSPSDCEFPQVCSSVVDNVIPGRCIDMIATEKEEQSEDVPNNSDDIEGVEKVPTKKTEEFSIPHADFERSQTNEDSAHEKSMFDDDKEFFLEKLETYNDVGEAVSGYLHDLTEAAEDLSNPSADENSITITFTHPKPAKLFGFIPVAYKVKVEANVDGDVEVKEPWWGKIARKPSKKEDLIREIELQHEKVRNNRQMVDTAFQNFDQKANQMYNLMSSVMKAFNEMRMGTIRNMI